MTEASSDSVAHAKVRQLLSGGVSGSSALIHALVAITMWPGVMRSPPTSIAISGSNEILVTRACSWMTAPARTAARARPRVSAAYFWNYYASGGHLLARDGRGDQHRSRAAFFGWGLMRMLDLPASGKREVYNRCAPRQRCA